MSCFMNMWGLSWDLIIDDKTMCHGPTFTLKWGRLALKSDNWTYFGVPEGSQITHFKEECRPYPLILEGNPPKVYARPLIL